MLFLHVLLFFVHFSSSAATRRNQPLREASASLQPPETESKINLGFIYWLPLTHFGAEGPRSDVVRPFIPVGPVPLKYTDNDNRGFFFVADLWDILPLEDKYTEDAKTYFYESDQANFYSKKVYLQDQSINKGWARIAEGKALRWRSQKGERKGVKIRFAEKTDEIYRNMLQNFIERVNSGSLKLNLAMDGLGQTFEPYIEFGTMYWMKPEFLGSPDAPGSKENHPVIPVGRVIDQEHRGRDLIFLAQLSGYLPLKNEYRDKAAAYFKGSSLTYNVRKRVLNDWMNIRWAQVALSVTFCYGRARGERKAVHMYEDKMEIIHLNMQKNYEQRVESGSLKLNFNKDDLNQFDLAGFVSVPEGIDDFLGYVHWMKSKLDSKEKTHLVVPVGKVPDTLEERYFVAELVADLAAELSNKSPMWQSYWESAAGYFPVEKIVTAKEGIVFKKWWINTSWAVEVTKDSLHRCKGAGQGTEMRGGEMGKILDKMLTNSCERRRKGESDFSIVNKPRLMRNQPQDSEAIGKSSRGAPQNY